MQIDLETLTKVELVQMAASAGLPTSGTKQALIDRLNGSNGPACQCGPGQTCGDHLPIPEGWPSDLPSPDLEVPTPAPLVYRAIPPDVPPMQDGEIRTINRQCFVAFRVSGYGRVESGALLDSALVDVRDLALSVAVGKGIKARAPRLAAWVADADGLGGIATIAMTIKGG